MADRAASNWSRLNVAFENYRLFIERKDPRLSLSLLDLLHVSNFKGGNASITSTEKEVDERLKSYCALLEKIDQQFGNRSLGTLGDSETGRLTAVCEDFLRLTIDERTSIKGFGPSYASALIAAHFPDLVPVLDRRIVNGLGLKADWDSQGQIKRIENHYGDVIGSFRDKLRREKGLTVRDLDKRLFVVPLQRTTVK